MSIKNFNSVILAQKDVLSIKKWFIRTCINNVPGYSLSSVYSDISTCPVCNKNVYQTPYFFGITSVPIKIIRDNPPSFLKPGIIFEDLRKISICHFDCLDIDDLINTETASLCMFITFKYKYSYYAFQYKPAIKLLRKYIFDRFTCYIEDIIDDEEYKKPTVTESEENYTGVEEITPGTQEEDIPSVDLFQGNLFNPAEVLGLSEEEGSFMGNMMQEEVAYLQRNLPAVVTPVKKQFKIYSFLKKI